MRPPPSVPVPSVDIRSSSRGHLGFAKPDTRSHIFAALADPTRRALMESLARGEATATSLSAAFPMSRQAITKHLSALADAGLITAHRVGREQRYELQPAAMQVAEEWMRDVGAAWERRLAALKVQLSGP